MPSDVPSSTLQPDTITIGSFASAACEATGIVVVIDVFRAFTTAAVALANGATKIVMETDSTSLSAEDAACCLNLNSVPFAIRVEVEDGLFVATAERSSPAPPV